MARANVQRGGRQRVGVEREVRGSTNERELDESAGQSDADEILDPVPPPNLKQDYQPFPKSFTPTKSYVIGTYRIGAKDLE